MDEVGREGKTLIFVSHSMQSINQLCSKAILLKDGMLAIAGSTHEVLEAYVSENFAVTGVWKGQHKISDDAYVSLVKARLLDKSGQVVSRINYCDPFTFQIDYRVYREIGNWALVLRIVDSSNIPVFTSWDIDSIEEKNVSAGNEYRAACFIPSRILKPGKYSVNIGAYYLYQRKMLDFIENAFCFELAPVGYTLNLGRVGVITPVLEWKMESVLGGK
jgi:lipopolysaccharide transport system ATP-binding protein